MKNKFSIALSFSVVFTLLITSLALADNLTPDGDVLLPGPNINVTSCATQLSFNGNAKIAYQGGTHFASNGGTLNISYSADFPVTASGSTTQTLPSGWDSNGDTFTFSGITTIVPANTSTGTYKVIVTVSGPKQGGGTYTIDNFFNVNVNCPTNTAPTVTVTGVANGASYEYDFVPAAGCSVVDAEDGNSSFAASLSAITGPLSAYGLGSQTASCSYTDLGGLTTSASAAYSINDTTDPALTVPADFSVQATSASGAAVSYSASATDAVGPAPVVSCSPVSGSTFALGTTLVTCSATDVAGNTGSASFNVTVVDTTPPAVTVPADMTAEAAGPSGAVVNFSASASDLVDGAVTPTCAPASGSTFALGTTLVTCSASDARGNTGIASFNVTVVDTTPPAVTVPADITAEATGPSGAAVSFSASASDLVDGAVTPTCVPASGSTFALGTTPVTCSATDAAGNTGSASFNVMVQDTTPPTLTLPANMTVPATSPAGAVVTFSASASDLVDGSVPVTCTPASGSTFAPGTTTVNCSATDAHGNAASGSFTVSVKYQLFGFYAPVDMNGILNVVKGGSTVPLKFEVFAGTTELTATSAIKSFVQTKVACDGTLPSDEIEVVTSGGTTLRYDTTGGQFIQNWQTPKLPGQCYRVTMTTQDGSSLVANFKLK